ncbi:hypothetical protein BDW66DRAFT_138395 [Aspergillus desertorum]
MLILTLWIKQRHSLPPPQGCHGQIKRRQLVQPRGCALQSTHDKAATPKHERVGAQHFSLRIHRREAIASKEELNRKNSAPRP